MSRTKKIIAGILIGLGVIAAGGGAIVATSAPAHATTDTWYHG